MKRQRYKALENRANTKLVQAKQQYMNRFLDSRASSQTLCQQVKSLGVGKNKRCSPWEFDPDGVLANLTISQQVLYWKIVNAIWEIKSNAVEMDDLSINFVKIILPSVV